MGQANPSITDAMSIPSHWTGYNAHFALFVISPDTFPKRTNISATTWMSSLIGLTKIAASSA
jgi:hypothetical protein